MNGSIIVWYGEGLGTAKQGQLNSVNLESIEDEYAAYCNDATMEVDGYICYNYELVESEVVTAPAAADQIRTKYWISESWTTELDGGATRDRDGTVYQILDGDDVWEIITWADEEYKDVVIANSSIRTGFSVSRVERYFSEVSNKMEQIEVDGLNKFLGAVCEIDDVANFVII